MNAKNLKKLQKALKMIEDAKVLINEVSASSEEFKYCSNANHINNFICSTIDSLSCEVSNFSK